MRPRLQHFFQAMDRYFADPARLEALYRAFPGWRAPRARMALYGAFVQGHVASTLEHLFPLTRRSVGARRWSRLVGAYTLTRPARSPALNALGEAFPSFLADRAQTDGLRPFVPALARFEWTDWAVYASEAELPAPPERLTVNPTLEVLEHPFQLCAFVERGGTGTPEAGAERALLWRHPGRLCTLFLPADAQTLLVLKMAVEGLSPEVVGQATGLCAEEVLRAVERCVAEGLVLSSAASSSG